MEQGGAGVGSPLLALLKDWRGSPRAEQDYGPADVVSLPRVHRGDPRGLNLARLALRRACLAGVEAQDASLDGAHLAGVVPAEAFTYPISVALSGNVASVVAGRSTGEGWL